MTLVYPDPPSAAQAGGRVKLPVSHVPPEAALLIACLRWPLRDDALETLLARAAIPLDWGLFVALAARHRVAALAEHALRIAGIAIPGPQAAMLCEAAQKSAWSELALAQELKALLNALPARPIVLKGLPLSMRAYGRLGLRYNRDIDLLIEYHDIAAVCAVLEARGFARSEPPPGVSDQDMKRWLRRQKDLVYQHPQKGHVIELHWRLFDNPYLMPFPDAQNRLQGEYAPGQSADILPADLDFIFCCVHGAHHAWSRLKWLADIGALYAKMPQATVEDVYAKARALRVHRPVAQALLLCARLLGHEIPAGILADARADWRIRVLDSVAHQALFAHGAAEIEDFPLGSTAKNATHYVISDSLRYRLSEALFDLTDLTGDAPARIPGLLRPVVRPVLWAIRQWRSRRP